MSLLKIISVCVLAIALFVVYKKSDRKPESLQNPWWGHGTAVKEDHKISNDLITISQMALDNLYLRLDQTKPFHPSHPGVAQGYGINTNVLEKFQEYWRHHYDWRQREKYINQYTHYYVKIRGLKIHFVHVIPSITPNVTSRPLLMLHGWPSTFLEFYEVIPRLINPVKGRDFVFELVIPSLPGFGFSDYPKKPGLSAIYIAQLFDDLMDILGHKKYYVHGADWGSNVAAGMSFRYPKNILGMHSTTCYVNTLLASAKTMIGKIFPSMVYEKGEQELCTTTANSLKFILEESGYFHIQATKPDTIGVALRDSPMGLAAYMLEKYSTLTNAAYRKRDDAGLTQKFTMEQLLDNIMIYWFTDSMTSAMRIYAEAFTNYNLEFNYFYTTRITVPVGCARFPNEILLSPRAVLIEKYTNLVHLTSHTRGGHFISLEEPDLVAKDIIMFVGNLEKRKLAPSDKFV